MLGMVIGVWAVITLMAIGEGASHDAQEAIRGLGANNVIIRSIKPPSMKTQMQGDWESFFKRWMAVYGLKDTDAERIGETVPGVKRVLPILSKRVNVLREQRNVDCQLIGTKHFYPAMTQSKCGSKRGPGAPRAPWGRPARDSTRGSRVALAMWRPWPQQSWRPEHACARSCGACGTSRLAAPLTADGKRGPAASAPPPFQTQIF